MFHYDSTASFIKFETYLTDFQHNYQISSFQFRNQQTYINIVSSIQNTFSKNKKQQQQQKQQIIKLAEKETQVIVGLRYFYLS